MSSISGPPVKPEFGAGAVTGNVNEAAPPASHRSRADITALATRSTGTPRMHRKSIGHSRRKQGEQGAWESSR